MAGRKFSLSLLSGPGARFSKVPFAVHIQDRHDQRYVLKLSVCKTQWTCERIRTGAYCFQILILKYNSRETGPVAERLSWLYRAGVVFLLACKFSFSDVARDDLQRQFLA